MKIIETKVYTFDELSDDTKEKARDWYRQGAMDYEWWDFVEEDGNGIKLMSFDLYRNEIEIAFKVSAENTAKLIQENHGKMCGTYKVSDSFLQEFWKTTEEDEEKREELEEEYKKAIGEEYLILLKQQEEYLMSNESVDEMIHVNEYTFTEDGTPF